MPDTDGISWPALVALMALGDGPEPSLSTLVVDAETGIVLRERNDGFGSVSEWVEISFGAELSDDLFGWTGESVEASGGRAEHEREMASRRAWLAARGIADLSWMAQAELNLHNWDDESGDFEATVHFAVSASVVRRRRSDADWDTRNSWPHEYRWSDSEWDWYVGTQAPLRTDEFGTLRTQLGSPPNST